MHMELLLDNGHYEGDVRDDVAHGKGMLICNDGSTYVGGWRDGSYCGQGTFKMTP